MMSTVTWFVSVRSRIAIFAAATLLTAANASTGNAATVTLSGTCTFVKAVASVNAGSNQTPCTHSGTYGSNDTIVVPVGNFNIGSPVNITRGMTIHGGGKTTANLVWNYPYSSYAIQVSNPIIVVKIDNLTLTAADPGNDVTGILVNGQNDTNLSDNNLELSYVVVSNFGDDGITNTGGRILIQHTLIYLNTGSFGGGVLNTNGQNNNGSWAVGSFVSKYSAISENHSTYAGGGIYNTAKMDLRSTLLQGNLSDGQGGAIFVPDGVISSASCNVTRDVPTAAPSEIDSNQTTAGDSIIYTGIPCSLHDTIGTGNTSPYCSSNVINCPQ